MKRFLICLFTAVALLRPSHAQDYTTGLQAQFPLNESSGLSCTDTVSGLTSPVAWYDVAPVWQNPGLLFSSPDPDRPRQWIVPNVANPLPAFNQMTISAWVKLVGGGWWSTVLEAGNSGQFFVGVMGGRMFLATDWYNGGAAINKSNATVPGDNTWVHLAWTWDGTKVRFYINGVKDSNEPDAGFHFNRDMYMGWKWPGTLRDVRLYNRALSGADLNALRAVPPPLFGPGHTGLWVGTATLNEVKEANTGNWAPTPAVFNETVILHIESTGTARLLPEATVMKTRVTPPSLPLQVVVSQSSLLPNYDGITLRGGKMIGQRFSTSNFPLPATGLMLSDGTGGWLTGTWTTAAADPLNPFRHKYHPDLSNGRGLTRTIWFHSNPGDSPVDNAFSTTLYEDLQGLHKTTLEARGPVTFTRVSTSGKLNQP